MRRPHDPYRGSGGEELEPLGGRFSGRAVVRRACSRSLVPPAPPNRLSSFDNPGQLSRIGFSHPVVAPLDQPAERTEVIVRTAARLPLGDKLSPQVFNLVWSAQVSAEDASNAIALFLDQMDILIDTGYVEQAGDEHTPLLENIRTVVRNKVALLTDQ